MIQKFSAKFYKNFTWKIDYFVIPYFTSFSWYKLFIKLYKSTWYRNGPEYWIMNGFLEH